MTYHSRTVANKKGNKMAKAYVRGSKIWISYVVDGVRKQKTTKLSSTPSNMKIVTNKILPQLELKIATGDIHKKKPKTFKYYGDLFLQQQKHIASYSSKSPKWNRVIEYFGDKNIDEISRLDLKQYLMSLNIKSASKGAFKNCINSVFELAVDDGVISFNPAMNIRLSPDKKNPIEYFSREDVKSLLSVTSGVMRVYLLIAFNTGMRSGEILGLQLGDFEKGKLNIRRTRTKGVTGAGKTWNSARVIPIPSFILEEVNKIQSDNIFIFGDIDDSGKLDYVWRKAKKLADVPNYRLYSTRHTFATQMLRDKIVSINELAGLLGHTSAKTTLDKYASVIESDLVRIDGDFSLFGSESVTKTLQFKKES